LVFKFKHWLSKYKHYIEKNHNDWKETSIVQTNFRFIKQNNNDYICRQIIKDTDTKQDKKQKSKISVIFLLRFFFVKFASCFFIKLNNKNKRKIYKAKKRVKKKI
jgi:hypothetical protein